MAATIAENKNKINKSAIVGTQWYHPHGEVVNSYQHSNGNIDIIGKIPAFSDQGNPGDC